VELDVNRSAGIAVKVLVHDGSRNPHVAAEGPHDETRYRNCLLSELQCPAIRIIVWNHTLILVWIGRRSRGFRHHVSETTHGLTNSLMSGTVACLMLF